MSAQPEFKNFNTHRSGFSFRLANGIIVSCAIGSGTYSDNHSAVRTGMYALPEGTIPAFSSNTVELALLHGDRFFPLPDFDNPNPDALLGYDRREAGDSVVGYAGSDEFTRYLVWAASLSEEDIRAWLALERIEES